MRGTAALLVLLAGCIDASLVPCGDIACPVGNVCTAGGCAAQVDVDACVNLLEGDECESTRVAVGACHGGACRPVACGDLVVDSAERCDDGNEADGDGCSATCRSDETCGNGVIDLVGSEDCDDGRIGLSNDGCSSLCGTELAAWVDVDPVPIAGRAGMGMIYDVARGEIVLFGGANEAGALGDLWLHKNGAWRQRPLGKAPAPRSHPLFVYDPVREKSILFGGVGNAGFLNDTWEWDGATWRELAPPTKPPARGEMAFTYDVARSRIVMFGGDAGLADTWEWDGTTWIERPVAGPPDRIWGAMAYDGVGQRVLLYGGLGPNNNGLTDTWTWDGGAWTQHTVGPVPVPSFGTAMARNPSTNRILLTGGRDTAFADVDATWEWDGSAWANRGASSQQRYHARMIYNAAAQRFEVFGGLDYPTWRSDMRYWTGSSWTVDLLAPLPPNFRGRAAVAYDARRGVVLLHGGYTTAGGTTYYDTLSAWSDGRWEQLGSPPISARSDHVMVYDASRDRMVLFGGNTASGRSAETWERNGSGWNLMTPVSSPPARASMAAAFHAQLGRVVMFGGVGTDYFGDTWTYDGSTWTQSATVDAPSPRSASAMAYDVARGVVVLFGGMTDSGTKDDTWLFDGSSWRLVTPSVSPSRRWLHSMYYDPVRARVVLTGGRTAFGIGSDTWEWDGTTWIAQPNLTVSTHWGSAVAYHAIERRPIMFGGFGESVTHGTRALVIRSPFGIDEQCRSADVDDDGDTFAGCADPDCWGRCKPLCPPGSVCPASAPTCGDGVCAAAIEDQLICPDDC